MDKSNDTNGDRRVSLMEYRVCPKCGVTNDSGPDDQCDACGVYYAKWLKHQLRGSAGGRRAGAGNLPGDDRDLAERVLGTGWLNRLAQPLIALPEQPKMPEVIGRLAVLLVMLVWGWMLVGTDFRVSTGLFPEISFHGYFLKNVTLIFHEAGHVLFSPFGRFMTVLGGSLFQLLVPLVLVIAFVYFYANPFGGAVALWWLGFSFMDLAPYVFDAKKMELLLLGGGTGKEIGGHDWHNLLSWTNSLQHHELFASLVDGAGELLMLTAVFWGAWLVKAQYQTLKKR